MIKLLREAERRKADFSEILKDSFQTQLAFINDPSRLKAALCTRRAGKSMGAGLYLVKESLENPGVSNLYIALTRGSAKRIMFKDVLQVINREYKLNAKFNDNELTMTFPNGSVIYLLGMDAKEQEQEKALGQKFKLIIIDEAASFRQDLRKIVYSTLKPTTADYEGTVAMIGTPSNITKGLFFDVTTGIEPGWSLHKWSAFDNPYMAEKWKREQEELIARNPKIKETPIYKQMYEGQWSIDMDALVYKYSDKLLVSSIPSAKLTYVLGIDLGYEDDSAFTLVGYSNTEPILYVIDTFKKSKMDLTDVANKINEFRGQYRISKFIVDGAAKQAVEELKRRHSIPLEAAEKSGKADFIEILNAELIQERIKFLQGKTDLLIDEMLALIWDEKAKKKQEHPNCPNHLCDSFLYAYRYSYHYLGKPPIKEPAKDSLEAIEAFWEREAGLAAQQAQRDWWEK